MLGADMSPLIEEVVLGVYRKRKYYSVINYFFNKQSGKAFHISPLMVIFTLLLSVSHLKVHH